MRPSSNKIKGRLEPVLGGGGEEGVKHGMASVSIMLKASWHDADDGGRATSRGFSRARDISRGCSRATSRGCFPSYFLGLFSSYFSGLFLDYFLWLFSSKSSFSGLFSTKSYFSGLFSANVTDGEAPDTQDLAGFGENWKGYGKK